MTRFGALLLVPVVLQAATLLQTWRMLRADGKGSEAAQATGAELWRRQIAVSILFFLASAAAFYWNVVDAYVVTFAVLFVLAQVIHAALFNRGNDAMSVVALRASAIALVGLAAMVALDVLPGVADTYQVP
ncbi:MAG: hypothetical protein ACK4MF_00255 [Hyphomicrobiaceae bacterium]